MGKAVLYTVIKLITKHFKTINKIINLSLFIVILICSYGIKLGYAQSEVLEGNYADFYFRDYMSQALKLIEIGDYVKARQFLEKAKEIYPDNEDVERFLERIRYLELLKQRQSSSCDELLSINSKQVRSQRIELMRSVLRQREMEDILAKEEALLQTKKYPSRNLSIRHSNRSKCKRIKSSSFVMRRLLSKYERRIKKSRAKRLVRPMHITFKEEEIRVTDDQRGHFIPIEIEVGYPKLLIFPRVIRHIVVLDPSLIKVKKISDYQFEIRPTGQKLGKTIIYAWDALGRWMFNLNVIPPKKRIERELEIAKKERKLREDIVLKYNAYWFALYTGAHLNDLARTSLSFTQTFSLVGPTSYGDLSSQLSLVKTGSGYKSNYKFVSLDHVHRFGLNDAKIISGDFFAGLSDFTFPGSSLEGVSFSEYSKNWSMVAFHGSPLNYWGYVPIIGIGNKPINGLRLNLKGLEFNLAFRNGEGADIINGERYLSKRAISLKLDKKIANDWHFKAELGRDTKNWATLLNLNKSTKKWDLHMNFRNVSKNYRTISGSPVYSGEVGSLLELSYNLSKSAWINSSLNVYKDRSYPEYAKRLNLEYSLQYGKMKKKSSYSVKFDYYSRAIVNGKVNTYILQGYYNRSAELFHKSIQYRYGFSYSLNKDKAFSQSIDVQRVSYSARWEIIKQWLSIYEDLEFGRVKDRYTGKCGWPKMSECGLSLSHRLFEDRLTWYFSASYRLESGGQMPYSFVSDRDLFALRGRINYELSPDKSMYVQANLKKYYPENEPDFWEGEVYIGFNWLWDTGINLLPKIFVYGRVFEDLNRNGKKDKNEKGLAGVRVRCDDKVVKTDAEGRYEIGWIRSQKSFVSLILSDLPSGMFPSKNKVCVVPANGKKQCINFPVRYLTGIEGVAFIDKNGNKKLDVGEKSLQNVKVCVGNICRYTDSTGGFIISSLMPGKYLVSIDLNTIPEDCIPLVPVKQTVYIHQGKLLRLLIPFRSINLKKKQR